MRSHRPAVELCSVDAHYDHELALDDVSVSVDPGSITAVIGPNGSGKSTMFALISGRMQPTSGTVERIGEVADVTQATSIDPLLSLTVDDVVRMGRYRSRGLLGRMRREDRRACDEALDRVDLLDLRSRPINQLSGGQRQRALVAQGIVQHASVLLLDEPAAGLDVTSQANILDVIRDEAERGRTVMFSTHQLQDTAEADIVIALNRQCVCCSPTTAAMSNPAVTSLFERH